MLSRRTVLRGGGGLVLAGSGVGAYAFGVEPGLRLDLTRYHLAPPGWPVDLPLTCSIIADIHACEPWMPVERIRQIVATSNAARPDIVFLLGDFNAGHPYVTGTVYPDQWSAELAQLRSPLGTFAILGNHDWAHGPAFTDPGDDAVGVRRALHDAGARLLENESVAVSHRGRRFWVAGLADQLATRGPQGHLRLRPAAAWRGLDDLPGTLAQVRDDAPVILLAHEPFVFPQVPHRVALTLCGHTHGGQVNLPVLTNELREPYQGPRHVYGHVVEGGRHMIISAGLGTSFAPVRFFRPPEIVIATLGGPVAA